MFSDINECEVYFPCMNNGTCSNRNGTYECTCMEGWQGHDCEKGTYIWLSSILFCRILL